MDNFIFRGRSIAEFGAVAAFGDSMRTGARILRSEYEMPGGGTAEIGEAAYQATAKTVTITPADGVTASPAWQRAILSWLQGGRGELVVLNDPDVYRIAQFDADGTYEWRSWPHGLLQMTMTLQPHAHARAMTAAAGATEGGRLDISLGMATQIPTPLEIAVTPRGKMTALEIIAGGETVRFDGLSLAAGQTLLYYAGDDCEQLASVRENGALTFAHVTRWAQLMARGRTAVSAAVSGCEADVRIRARCRYPA